MILLILRGAFIILAATVAMLYVLPFQKESQVSMASVVLMLGGTLAISSVIIALDVSTRRKKLSAMSGVFLGLLAGLLAAYAMSFVVDLIGAIVVIDDPARQVSFHNLLRGVKVVIGLITCYLSISLVVQTKDDFRFVLPYVEFAKQVRGNKPILLDTSVIIDGRVHDIVNTKFFQGSLIVPKFVLHELQAIADSPDKLRRARGRRGLDTLQKLQDISFVDVAIDSTEAEGANVDQKLVSLAQTLQARVMTNDFNLNKIATLRGVDVINLNDLAKALRPVVLPGESMRVKIIKPGETMSQGVGYLEDGTMVVVENARTLLGQETDIVVTSTLQTSAGRMIFGRRTGTGDEDHANHHGDTHHPQDSMAHPGPPSSADLTPLPHSTPAAGNTPLPRNRPNYRHNPRPS